MIDARDFTYVTRVQPAETYSRRISAPVSAQQRTDIHPDVFTGKCAANKKRSKRRRSRTCFPPPLYKKYLESLHQGGHQSKRVP